MFGRETSAAFANINSRCAETERTVVSGGIEPKRQPKVDYFEQKCDGIMHRFAIRVFCRKAIRLRCWSVGHDAPFFLG